MRGDFPILCAYGAGLTISATLKSVVGAPVNIAGYSARLILQRFDDSNSWLTVMSLTSGAGQITNGGASGLFTATLSAANTTALSAFFGSPVPNRRGRFELYATPSAGAEALLLHGEVEYLQEGESVDPVTVDVYEDTFTVTVSALAPAGPAGAAGATGPAGPIVPVTYSANGAMIATDKILFDGHHVTTKYVLPSNTAAATAPEIAAAAAADDAAIAAAIASKVGVVLGPGVFWTTAKWNLEQLDGVTIRGAAKGRSDLASGTIVRDARLARVPGDAMVSMRSASGVKIRDIHFVPALAEVVFDLRFDGRATQSCSILDCDVTWTNAVYDTSSTSMALTTVQRTVTVSAGKAYALGERLLFTSRSGDTSSNPNAQLWCTVTGAGYSGTSLTITPDEVDDTALTAGSKADWDIRKAVQGVITQDANNIVVDGCNFARLYRVMQLDGNGIIYGDNNSTSAPLGPYQVWSTTGSKGHYIGGNFESANPSGRASGALVTGSLGAILAIKSGDQAHKGEWIYLNGAISAVLRACVLDTSSATDALVRLKSSSNTTVQGGRFGGAGTGYAYDFSGSGNSGFDVGEAGYPGLSVPFYLGTIGSSVVGIRFIAADRVHWDDGYKSLGALQGTFGAHFGPSPGSFLASCVYIGNRSSTAAHAYVAGAGVVIGPTSQYASSPGLHIFPDTNDVLNGVHLFVKDASHANGWVPLLSAIPAGLRLTMPLGYQATLSLDSASNWHVNSKTLIGVRGASNQDLAFSAALAALTSETKTVTITGAAVGDVVSCSPRAGIPDGATMAQPWVSSASTVSVKIYNGLAATPVDLSGVRLDFTLTRPA